MVNTSASSVPEKTTAFEDSVASVTSPASEAGVVDFKIGVISITITSSSSYPESSAIPGAISDARCVKRVWKKEDFTVTHCNNVDVSVNDG